MLPTILTLLIKYRYYLLFPLAIVEGPILAVICGFLCNSSLLKFWMVYPILILGDNIGDTIYYLIGRYARSGRIKKISNWLGLTDVKLEKARLYSKNNSFKWISISKLIPAVGVSGLFMAGKARISYRRFYMVCLVTSIFQCGVYMLIGWFFGIFYQTIGLYLDNISSGIIILVLVSTTFYIIKKKFIKK